MPVKRTMSYSPDFLNDVFISYASSDEGDDRLISFFADQLEKKLAGQGVRESLTIYLDQTGVRDGRSLSKQILAGAKSTAVMVAFHSQAYDDSKDWCQREYREFVLSNPDIQDRFFLIALDGGFLPSQSPVFKGADRHFRAFFTEKKGNYFRFSPNKKEYVNRETLTLDEEIERLAREIADTLKRLRDASTKRVFLTTCSAFEEQARDLRDKLTGSGFIVAESSPWIEDNETRRSEAAARIERAQLVIGIAENLAVAEESQLTVHAKEQRQILAHLKKPRLQWLPSEKHGFSTEEVAALKSQGDVIAGTLEEFRKIVVNRLSGRIATPLPPLPSSEATTTPGTATTLPPPPFALFISAPDDESGALAKLIGQVAKIPVGIDARVQGPLAKDTAAIETWCRELKESVAQLHHTAVVFVDGNCPRDWIDLRLRNYLILERDLPTTPKAAVCECPPDPKPELRLFRPRGRIEFLSCDNDVALREFLLA